MLAFRCATMADRNLSNAVTVVDYGVGNLLSVARALEHCGAIVKVTTDPDCIRRADRVVLPGVGAFGDCVAELAARRMDDAIRDFAATERPLLGICVGMQVLFTRGTEFGDHPGLGLISGVVVAIPRRREDGTYRRIPHVGWAPLDLSRDGAAILAGTASNAAAYFVHSFHAEPSASQVVVATSDYQGAAICAAVADGNIFGCQFHPEKSGPVGLRILGNFLRL